jgi:hypothetical protein
LIYLLGLFGFLNGTAWRGIGLLSDLMMDDDDEHLTGRTGAKRRTNGSFHCCFQGNG